jgi:UDP-N-acetylmuramoyl-tripeptide--D-alanyl-D-alanine ligase
VIPLSLQEVAEIVGGRVADAEGDVLVTGPAFLDSRAPEPGGLFVAFAGERVDGHEYAGRAVAGGAAAVLGSRATGVPSVVVDDTQAALQELARVVLSRLRGGGDELSVLAVTGSSGKTSAKDMLDAVLSDDAATVATAGSFNNELGLPLTVLRATPETRYLVLEMGARGVGHLAELCAIAPPDISLVLNVGRAHIGEFGSQENIAIAKGELVEALGPDGTAVLNADDPHVVAMASRTSAEVRTFGRSPETDLDELGRPSFDLVAASGREHVSLLLLGEHQADNAAAVAATALAAGLELGPVARSLGRIEHLSRWRMEIRQRADGLVVLNDAYNANPDSMRAALQTLAAVARGSGRHTIAVLGEMRELGDTADAEHRALGRTARDLGIDEMVLVGEGARAIGDAHPRAVWFPSVEEAITAVRHKVGGSEVVLVKASRAAALERVAEALLADTGQDSDSGEETTT